ncbi:MAG: glycosyltransferase family 39 protein [Gemmatimonadetes bacterium]|nr:glycosyltransferase family 39 protein [Gemmatimonadota bacterium]
MERRTFLILIGLVILLRLVSLGESPLFDKTEGRYAEVGREMIESGNWITPTLHGGEPFWGKPPLHFWMTAVSMAIFGRNEWGARMPGFFSYVLMVLLFYRAVRQWDGARTARLATLVLASAALPFIVAGQVLLDATFTLAVTGALIAYGDLLDRGSGRYAFWAWLGLVLLAKGPVGVVLVIGAIVIHAILRREMRGIGQLMRPAVLLPGLLLAACIAAPWYLLAERATPGFSYYFFWQEHVLRYVKKDYGDLYGHGHVAPYGLIWAITLVGLLPWTVSLIATLRARIAGAPSGTPSGASSGAPSGALSRAASRKLASGDAWALGWALSPLLFFTLSRSLSMPYAFPAFGGIAWLFARSAERAGIRALSASSLVALVILLAGGWFGARDVDLPAFRTAAILLPLSVALAFVILRYRWFKGQATAAIAIAALLFPVTGTLLTFFALDTVGEEKSTRVLRRAIPVEDGRPIYFFDGIPLSAEFYFGGKAVDLRGEPRGARALLEEGGEEILIVRRSKEQYLPQNVAQVARPLAETRKYRIYVTP